MTDLAGPRSIKGHVDGLEGSYLTGWAISLSGSGNCAIEIVDETGTVVGAARASRVRPDLAALGHGRSNFAFRIRISDLRPGAVLRVYADGVELEGSQIRIGPGFFDGYMSVENGTVTGWVLERCPASEAPLIHVVDQSGRILFEGPATADTHPASPHFAPWHFRFPIPDDRYGAAELHLRALAGGIEFAKAKCALRLTGYLDSVGPDHCAGWLVSPDVPRKRFEIEVVRNGRIVGTGVCNVPRPDLREHFPSSWEVGFNIRVLPDAEVFTATSSLSFRLVGTDKELFAGPFTAGHRHAFIAAARRAARLTHISNERLGPSDRAALQAALVQYTAGLRDNANYILLPNREGRKSQRANGNTAEPRLSIIIPIYKGVEITRACIDSVLACRDIARDAIILVNDCSPEADMTTMLAAYDNVPNVYILENEQNQGFVRSVNRALHFCQAGDIILLNSDTRLFAGGIDELYNVAQSADDIGTVTALSNNATIFSYPHPTLPSEALEDVSWEELAAIALERNSGCTVDVPTGHGFCMLIKREVLDDIPLLDEQFGLGYGEENAFCLRAEDLGFRHVAATGVLVEHRESVSFGDEMRLQLSANNLPLLERLYPEYTGTVMDFQRRDELRRARWALDSERLRRFGRVGSAGRRFALIVQNRLGGGTQRAINDLEAYIGYGAAATLRLSADTSGMTLECDELMIRSFFLHNESEMLYELLVAAQIDLVMVHQLLGFSAGAIRILRDYIQDRQSICYVHDFFPICPRVTMLDAVGRFCNVGTTERCGRCIKLGGVHEASRTNELDADEHRVLLGGLLAAAAKVIAPSANTASYINRVMPNLPIDVVPHLETGLPPDRIVQADGMSGYDNIVLLGAIGPNKGSGRLLDLARHAWLSHPEMHFHVIGYTDIDDALKTVGNVTVTGSYKAEEMQALVDATGGRIALFLSEGPETFSYTLSEAVRLGLYPVVPDIGAPPERIRSAGYGAIIPYPTTSEAVLDILTDLKTRRVLDDAACSPLAFTDSRRPTEVAHAIGLSVKQPSTGQRVVRVIQRR
jgi:GT2 family glycosyltransferase/glycosyltransferase involved in cell wall biosynthesis